VGEGARPERRAKAVSFARHQARGRLGHLAVQYARILGGKVTAVDIEDAKLGLAEALGADHVVNARDADPVLAIRELGGADVAICLATSARAFEQAFGSLRRGGRLVVLTGRSRGDSGRCRICCTGGLVLARFASSARFTSTCCRRAMPAARPGRTFRHGWPTPRQATIKGVAAAGQRQPDAGILGRVRYPVRDRLQPGHFRTCCCARSQWPAASISDVDRCPKNGNPN